MKQYQYDEKIIRDSNKEYKYIPNRQARPFIFREKPKQHKKYEDKGELKGFVDETFLLNYLIMNELNENKDTEIKKEEVSEKLVESTIKHMDKYEFNLFGSETYDFIYNDFCSNYIEFSKFNSESNTTKSVLCYILTGILKMLHPFMPFVTEEIYSMLPIKEEESIMITEYPKSEKAVRFKLNNIEMFIGMIERWENNPENMNANLYAYLNRVTLMSSDDLDDEAVSGKVNLMTIHASKGLEFPVVFIAGVEEVHHRDSCHDYCCDRSRFHLRDLGAQHHEVVSAFEGHRHHHRPEDSELRAKDRHAQVPRRGDEGVPGRLQRRPWSP